MSEFTETNSALSAYLDGELSGESLAEVEQRLAESEAARDDLAELREVSQILRVLPVDRAPVELASAVMAQVESEMLLPRPTVVRPVESARPARGFATIGVAGVALVALVAVVTNLPLSNDADDSPRMAETSKATESELSGGPDQVMGGARAGVAIPSSVKAGDIIQFCEDSEGLVAVVELTVVDVEKSIDRLEVLLMDGNGRTRTERKPLGDSTEKTGESGLRALYVERDRTELRAALGEFLGDEALDILEADLASPAEVDVAAVDESEAEKVELLEQALQMAGITGALETSVGVGLPKEFVPQESPLRVIAKKRDRPVSPPLPEEPTVAAHEPDNSTGLPDANIRVLFLFNDAVEESRQ